MKIKRSKDGSLRWKKVKSKKTGETKESLLNKRCKGKSDRYCMI